MKPKLTIEQQRKKTHKANAKRQNLHSKCEVKCMPMGPHMGLYCANAKCSKTGKWITWVKKSYTHLTNS